MATLKVRDENNNFVDIPFVSGPAGKSAYEVWLENGNTGSEAAFLTSLKAQVPVYESENNSVLHINPVPPIYIIFYIYDTPYQAIEGMTWEEFINSSYNTNGYFTMSEYVFYNNTQGDWGYVQPAETLDYLAATDIIIANQVYWCNNQPI